MKYRYDVFGNLFTQMAAPYNTVGYTGKSYDAKASLMDYSARWYSPNYGRFITEDTFLGWMDEPLSLNKYSYVHNNPINFIDPTGHWQDGDENLPSEAQDAIQDLTDQYNNASTQEERDAAHASAEAIRDQYNDGGDSGSSGGGSDGGGTPNPGPTIQELILQRDNALINNAGTIPDNNESNLGKTLLTGTYNFLIGDDIASLRDGKLDFNDIGVVVTTGLGIFIPGIGKVAAKAAIKVGKKVAPIVIDVGKKVLTKGTQAISKVEDKISGPIKNLLKKDKGIPAGASIAPKINTTINSKILSTGEANSITRRVDANGKVISERYYDSNGRAIKDTHYTDHGNPKRHPQVPHEHKWDWSDPKNPRPSK